VIENYRNLDLNRGEKVALEDVIHMLDAYGTALDTISTMLADGAEPKDIDAKVKVDDMPALRALDLLAHEANLEILDRSRVMDVSLQKNRTCRTGHYHKPDWVYFDYRSAAHLALA